MMLLSGCLRKLKDIKPIDIAMRFRAGLENAL